MADSPHFDMNMSYYTAYVMISDFFVIDTFFRQIQKDLDKKGRNNGLNPIVVSKIMPSNIGPSKIMSV